MMTRQNRLPVIVAWAVGIFLGLVGLVGQIWGSTETLAVDYRLFLTADSVWIVHAVNGAKQSDSVKYSSVAAIDTSLTIANDSYEQFWFCAFGDGYASVGTPTLYTYDNHKVGDTATSSGGATFVIADTTVNGDTVATMGADQDFRLKTLTVTNQTGDAVTFAGGISGGDPIAGDALVLTSNYNGDGLVATGNGTGVDIRGDITGSLTGNVSGSVASATTVNGIANGAITTSTFATGAINSNVLATNCITSDEIATSAANEISLDVWSETIRTLSTTSPAPLYAGSATKIADSVWGIVNASYGRQLTMLDEDSTTIDLNASAVGSVTSDVNVADADMGNIADSVWGLDTSNANTAATYGVLLKDTSSYQGGASSLTSAAIADAVWNEDTTSHTTAGSYGRYAKIAGDSTIWADLSDVWRNQDTANVDSSDIGAWITNNSGAAASSNWSNAQRDSVLAAIADAGKLGVAVDTINGIIDTLQSQDGWVATASALTTNTDSVNAILDTLQLWDTRVDSIEAALADGSVGDKVWLDYSTRLTSDGNWTNTQIDSVLNALDSSATGGADKYKADVSSLLTTTDSALVKNLAQISAEISDSMWNSDTSGHNIAATYGVVLKDTTAYQGAASGLTAANIWSYDTASITTGVGQMLKDTGAYQGAAGGGSDTTAILAMMNNNAFAKNTDSLLLKSRAEIAGQIEDSVHGNAADYKATGFSTHSALDVYNTFTAGTNEQSFWIADSVRQQIAGLSADSVGNITASVDTVAIARSVWNEVQANHTTAGTMGDMLDATISSIAGLSGNGAYTYSITVLDTGASVDSVLGSGTVVYVNNVAQNLSGGPYQVRTGNTGVASFNLDAGSWVMFTTEPGFAAKLDTFTVSATASDTLMLYRDAGNRTTVSWYLKQANGTAYQYAVISINLKAVHPYDSMLTVSDSTVMNMLNYEVVDTADVNGLFSVNLWPNSSLVGDSSYYQITARNQTGRFIQKQNGWKYNVPQSDTTVWVNNLTRWK